MRSITPPPTRPCCASLRHRMPRVPRVASLQVQAVAFHRTLKGLQGYRLLGYVQAGCTPQAPRQTLVHRPQIATSLHTQRLQNNSCTLTYIGEALHSTRERKCFGISGNADT